MSEANRKFEFSVVDVQWLRKSLQFQQAGLIRSRGKETVGSEIYVLRSREIEALSNLIMRIGG